MKRDEVVDGPTPVESPLLRSTVGQVVRVWAAGQMNLPNMFADEASIVQVRRQPVTFVCAEAQRVSRELNLEHEPYPGGNIDADDWPTEDLFELLPLEPSVFPPQQTSDSARIAGREQVRPCGDCQGAGSKACTGCRGAGVVVCRVCQGAGNVKCQRCSGVGFFVRGGQSVEPCRDCNQGTVPCRGCKEGMVTCTNCEGSKQVLCNTCLGHGNLKHFWRLSTLTQVVQKYEVRCQEPWPISNDDLFSEAETISAVNWNWPFKGTPAPDLQSTIPSPLRPVAQNLLQTTLTEQGTLQTDRQRVSGIRVRLLSSYAYEVTLDFKGRRAQLVIAGSNCLVYPVRLPKPQFGEQCLIVLNRLFSRIGLGVTQGLRQDYLKGVRGRTTHVMDVDCLFTELAQLGADVQITAEGYRVALTKSREIVFDVTFDLNSSAELIVSTSHCLGRAHRDLFPKVLALNHQLGLGRIGVAKNPQTSEEEFSLLDRRSYKSIDARDFLCILMELTASSNDIQTRKILA